MAEKKVLTPEEKERAEKYAKMKLADLLLEAKERGKEAVIWLAKKMKETEEYKIYPKVEVVKPDGTKSWKYDTKANHIDTKTRNIPFTKVKHDFCEKYMPELLPTEKKATGSTMLDEMDKLLAEMGISEEDLK